MSSIYGKNYKISVFGESHQKAIGVVIDSGISGIPLDISNINQMLERRKTKNKTYSTSRQEDDDIEIISGYYSGRTTGAPLTIIIKNKDAKSEEYSNISKIFRPSHSDYTSFLHYFGANDSRGGGHFSGRLTAPIVIAGAIAMQILRQKYGILFLSHIFSAEDVQDRRFKIEDMTMDTFKRLRSQDLPLLNETLIGEVEDRIKRAKEDQDSIGGMVETAVINMPEGVGEPIFDSLESRISHMLFSVPAVKSVEFGRGIELTKMRGSVANDTYYYDDKGDIKISQNNSGGILGGISTGEPIIWKVGIKPASSIGKVQKSVDFDKKENVDFAIKGRHDSFIVPRAIPVIECSGAIAILDALIEEKGREYFCERVDMFE